MAVLWAVDSDPIELRPDFTESDLQTVIRAVYKQVLGNAHLLESDRFVSAESYLRNGEMTVRQFVSAVANSDLYRDRFFNASSQYRFIELNFKHLLGRAPEDQAEISAHVQLYAAEGYEAEISSYVDSEEYLTAFGENIVPYARGTQSQVGSKNVSFNRAFGLLGGFASSDSGTASLLVSDLAANLPTAISEPSGIGAYTNTSKRFRIVVSKGTLTPVMKRSVNTYEVDYAQLTQRIQSIQKLGGSILSITEVA
ncbi:MAG: phycobilisome rod-core linker polypeptide [Cyanobacteria bacterium P01_G01_bin.54]